MIRRPPRSTQSRSSAASDVYKRQLIVLGQAPKLAQPSEGSFYYPTAMLDGEALGARQLGHDLHGPAKLLLDPPRHRSVARVCPQVPQPLKQGSACLQEFAGSIPVLYVGRMHHHLEAVSYTHLRAH